MVNGANRLYQLFGPGCGFVVPEKGAEKRSTCRDGSSGVEIAVVGGPPKGGAQVGQLDREPVVRLALARAVPQRQDVGFPSGEVTRVGGPDLGCFAGGDELFLGELADRLQHRVPGPPC